MTGEFTHLNSINSKDGEADLDKQSPLNKPRSSLNMMNTVWRAYAYSTCTKLKLYHTCVVTTLLYSLECRRLAGKDLPKLSTFHSRSQHLLEQCKTKLTATALLLLDWPCHPPTSLHRHDCHMKITGGGRKLSEWKDLEQHSSIDFLQSLNNTSDKVPKIPVSPMTTKAPRHHPTRMCNKSRQLLFIMSDKI